MKTEKNSKLEQVITGFSKGWQYAKYTRKYQDGNRPYAPIAEYYFTKVVEGNAPKAELCSFFVGNFSHPSMYVHIVKSVVEEIKR